MMIVVCFAGLTPNAPEAAALTTAANLTLEFGSRSGSWTALVLFVLLFGVLGWSVARAIRRRSRAGGVAHAVGPFLFIAPLLLVWTSSLGGFYTAETDGRILRLHSLLPGVRAEIMLKDIAVIEARPAHRGRWRMHVVSTTEKRYESATWHRDRVERSRAQLERWLHQTGR
jgi:hypothetical protein